MTQNAFVNRVPKRLGSQEILDISKRSSNNSRVVCVNVALSRSG